MKTILETIQKASDLFLFGYAHINREKIKTFKIDFSADSTSIFTPPKYLNSLLSMQENGYEIIHVYNAINASLQYSFFSADALIRFDSIDSSWITNMLDDVFMEVQIKSTSEIQTLQQKISSRLIDSNITMLETRIQTINELFDTLDFVQYGKNYSKIPESIQMLKTLVCFKRDLFFKKGLLAIMMTNRMISHLQKDTIYQNDLYALPVPADYQIPKILRHFDLISFHPKLIEKIDTNEIFIENSDMELNIRAVTVQACQLLAHNNHCSTDDIDAYLFTKRHKTDLKHHLCFTTNY